FIQQVQLFAFFVCLANRAECVLVEASQHVQSVFFGSAVLVKIHSTRALSAQSPAHLIDSDHTLLVPIGIVRQPKSCCHRGWTAAKNGDALFSSFRHTVWRWRLYPHDPLVSRKVFASFSLRLLLQLHDSSSQLGFARRTSGGHDAWR